MKKGERIPFIQPREVKAQGDLISLTGSYREDRGSLFMRAHDDQTRGNRHKDT